MRRAARADGTQREIVEALRAAGCSVQHLHTVGDGCPDLLVGVAGRTLLMEIKDGSRPASERLPSAEQRRWAARWRGGGLWVVCSVDEALSVVNVMRGTAR